MKRLFVITAVCAAGIAMASGPILAQSGFVAIGKAMEADPLCQKYIQLVGMQGSGAYKESTAKALGGYGSRCQGNWFECDKFWDAPRASPWPAEQRSSPTPSPTRTGPVPGGSSSPPWTSTSAIARRWV